MRITQIKTAAQLWEAYTEDYKTKATDFKEGAGIVKRFACTKLLVFDHSRTVKTTNEWFITYRNNELIFNIKENDWINLNMFETGESYCKELLLIEEDNQ